MADIGYNCVADESWPQSAVLTVVEMQVNSGWNANGAKEGDGVENNIVNT